MEPTGHYGYNLANWLTDKGKSVVMVNPATTKRNKENRDNSPSKSDPKDVLVIADVISRGYYYEYSRQAIVFQKLRTMMSASPQDIESLSVSEVITGWREHMKRAGGSMGTQKAAQLRG
jgi:transposase